MSFERNKLLDSAFMALFDLDPGRYNFSLTYSGRFKGYNANVKYLRNDYTFNLSKEWKGVGSDIVVGVVQYLMLKCFGDTHEAKTPVTLNVDMYNQFLKEVHKYKPKDKSHPILKDSFDRVNEAYFAGTMDETNLVWGGESVRTLGHYSYGADEITISKVFMIPQAQEFLDFVMFHEMLHKKHQFATSKTGRNLHHSSAFRREEKKFKDFKEMEKRLHRYLARC